MRFARAGFPARSLLLLTALVLWGTEIVAGPAAAGNPGTAGTVNVTDTKGQPLGGPAEPGQVVVVSGKDWPPGATLTCFAKPAPSQPQGPVPADRIAGPIKIGQTGDFSVTVRLPGKGSLTVVSCSYQRGGATFSADSLEIDMTGKFGVTFMSTPSGGNASANAVNGFGQVTGDFASAGGGLEGFLYSGGVFNPIVPPGGFAGLSAITMCPTNPCQQVFSPGPSSAVMGGTVFDASGNAFAALIRAKAGGGFAVAELAQPSGTLESQLLGLSSFGAVGDSFKQPNAPLPTFWPPGQGGVLLPLPSGDTQGDAFGINPSGVAVGDYLNGSTPEAGVWQNQTSPPATLGTLGGPRSIATSINSLGTISGYSDVSGGGLHGGLFYSSAWHDLGALPGSTSSGAFFLNDLNQTVGASTPSGGSVSHAVLFTGPGGPVIDLNSVIPAGSGLVLNDAFCINAPGQIVGVGTRTSTGKQVGFLLNPIGAAGPLTGQVILSPGQSGPFRSATVAARHTTVAMGGTVEWQHNGPGTGRIVDSSGMSLFDSGPLGANGGYAFRFDAAGTYGYHDPTHSSLTGSVAVPVLTAPAKGTTKTLYQVYWSSASPSKGQVFDVQVRRPGAASFSNWKTGQAGTETSFVPDHGKGVYSFRARTRKGGKSSGWSPAGSITVH